ncbi:RagB/SusD family nutrient uptake outer membrane protein [uncultured Nonlabens sp.]|uniref:RagB/SusD family nutrient uptake outer membrane protein n=1 Tax=uncultured Nonlabens sp. TaxID=859306 RepID=UPI00260E9B09|nr:RagB/SusD family nutrient uptake outer membrane protein [uncultured Nonlabens sp.]
MKNIKYLFFAFSIAFIGCSDLEEEPIGQLTPDGFYTSNTAVQSTINGAYGLMGEEAFWGRKLSLPLMVRGDLARIGINTSQRRRDHDEFTVSDDNGMIIEYWPRAYQVIATCNQAIAGSESVGSSPETLNPIIAQAYFVRAYVYYHLVRLHGDIPYLDTPVTDLSAASSIAKTSEADVYQNIINDLMFAEQWLPNTQPTRALPSKATAMAYLASVYLTRGEYPMAAVKAQDIIRDEALFDLELEDDFADLWDFSKQQSSKEPLFSLDFNGFRDGDFGQDYMPALTGIRDNITPNGEGWSVIMSNEAFYNAWPSDDYRRDVSFVTESMFLVNGIPTMLPYQTWSTADSRNLAEPFIAKYNRNIGTTSNSNGRGSELNYAQMRYAEVLLIAAEALNEAGPSAIAEGYLNRVRARARNAGGSTRSTPLSINGLSQDDFRDAVLTERTYELAFEFKRWYDIKRRNLGNEVFSGPNAFEERPNFDPSRDYLLPLPADEIARNPNLLPNNPGY